MSIDLTSLNENQRKAVLWNAGPLLVLAGPGSGKTRVLAFRIARLLDESADASILALTFSRIAAVEMRERVDHFLGRRGDRAHLCTFHSFANDLLRQHGAHLGLQPDFQLVQDDERLALLEPKVRELTEAGYLLPNDIKNLLGLLDHLFREPYDGGADVPGWPQTPPWLPLLFEGYCTALIAENRLDFGGLLYFARRLLHKPAVARVVRLAWTHVCVDEFQDTNKAQYHLLKMLANSDDPNLFIVGDDDQILYQWNGASPERLKALLDDFRMTVIQLPENYRCPPSIIRLANKLISHNRLRTPDKEPLTTGRAAKLDDKPVRYGVFDSPKEELAGVANDIQARKLSPGDCVVLARTSKILAEAAKFLRSAGFEVYLAQRKNDFECPLTRVFIYSLRLANARHDHDLLRRLCLSWKALTERTIELDDVSAKATLLGGDFLRAWVDAAAVGTEGPASLLLTRIRSGLVDRLDFPRIVEWFLSEGWKPWEEQGDRDLRDEIETWRELHTDITCDLGQDELTLNSWLQKMALAPKTSRPGPNALRCITVHGSKGLEFKHVYLIGMAQEVFPSFQAIRKGPDSGELEEERRSCFVAVTRVQDTLTLTRSRQYYGWPKEPSQFLGEMGLKVD